MTDSCNKEQYRMVQSDGMCSKGTKESYEGGSEESKGEPYSRK